MTRAWSRVFLGQNQHNERDVAHGLHNIFISSQPPCCAMVRHRPNYCVPTIIGYLVLSNLNAEFHKSPAVTEVDSFRIISNLRSAASCPVIYRYPISQTDLSSLHYTSTPLLFLCTPWCLTPFWLLLSPLSYPKSVIRQSSLSLARVSVSLPDFTREGRRLVTEECTVYSRAATSIVGCEGSGLSVRSQQLKIEI
ncbi:uncharacterized protein EI90DRAFT_2584010 [Cantharellus anzutake]|uniref:uncharacterized protein n=1 Tax=Cantharellus anzutake TaxID=1750568 RepID=UPI001904E05C|nr:uncharacterized protein EI90DRAFT_2584010 [Cantharellus anzutake]KAF8320959.1 hypothetical protein EI90DRAFT_2584010 [Cantharellus anzutake]